MYTRLFFDATRRLLFVAVLATWNPLTTEAQQATPAASLPAYRPPALALVQPAAGGSLPSDKPVLVFRFAPGEANDPIDAHSFTVTVNGVDRTDRFQVTAAEGWGPLADAEAGGVRVGPRQVFARVCSTRGACAEVAAVVPVVESAPAQPAQSEASGGVPRRKILDAVVAAIRKLLEP
jgi:hypothetical protein